MSSKTLSGRARLVWNGSYERRQWNRGLAYDWFRMGLLHGRLQGWLLLLQSTSLNFPQWVEERAAACRLRILTCYEAKTAKRCVGRPEFSNFQVSVRGINATKVLDVDKQVDLIWPTLMFLSCVPVLRLRGNRLHCSSPSLGKAGKWLSISWNIPWRTGSPHTCRWAEKKR